MKTPLPVATFEGTCISLEVDPHALGEFHIEITKHHPEHEDDHEHRHHGAPACATHMTITEQQMKHFVPGKRYRVTITAVEDL